jgi:hypothetical protein
MVGILTPDEKARIKQEEFLRAEIRKELTPAPTTEKGWRQKIWKFLNSTFGIWLFSTVIVAGVVHLYDKQETAYRERETQRKEQEAESRRTRELYERVAIEISFRFSSTMAKLKAVSKKYGERLDAESQAAISEAFDPLLKPAVKGNPPLYPEYEYYSGLALIAELRRHAGPAERLTLTEILANTSGFIGETVGDKSLADKPAAAVALELLRRMRYAPWNVGFPYTACPDTKTFC